MEVKINSAVSKISQIHSATADFLARRLKENGFDEFASSHGNILFQLRQKPCMKMKELSDKINRDKSTTTVLVRKLEKLGLVSIETDEKDKRNKFISLTEKGKKYNETTGDISQELIKKFYNGFSEEEKLQFCEFLERISFNFSEV